MCSPEGLITRLIARVRALFPNDWRAAAGERFRHTAKAVSDFAEEHQVRPGDLLGEGVELGRRILEGLANQELAQALKNFADAEKVKIDAELQRRSLEVDIRRKEAEARKAPAEARIQESKAVEAEFDLVQKLKQIGVVVLSRPMFGVGWQPTTQSSILVFVRN